MRNSEKFPEVFSFQLTPMETDIVSRSQNVTLNIANDTRGFNIKYLPYAFTEQGIYMLMTVLKGSVATSQSIALIRAFKSMKDYIVKNQQLIINQADLLDLAKKVNDQSQQIMKHTQDIIAIRENMVSKSNLSDIMKLFNDGVNNEEFMIMKNERFTADVVYQKIYRRARSRIVVIDNYIGVKTLQHLTHAKKNVKITIISDNIGKCLRKAEFTDFISEYPDVQIRLIKSGHKLHDRYIILDDGTKAMKVYHCGTSSKDAGKTITTITELHDTAVYTALLRQLMENGELTLK